MLLTVRLRVLGDQTKFPIEEVKKKTSTRCNNLTHSMWFTDAMFSLKYTISSRTKYRNIMITLTSVNERAVFGQLAPVDAVLRPARHANRQNVVSGRTCTTHEQNYLI